MWSYILFVCVYYFPVISLSFFMLDNVALCVEKTDVSEIVLKLFVIMIRGTVCLIIINKLQKWQNLIVWYVKNEWMK